VDARLAKIMPGRNAGEEHAGTQGWRRSRQVAMPAKIVPGRKAMK